MKRLFATLVVNAICLVAVSYLFDGIEFAGGMILPLTIAFTLLNMILKPILKVLTLPINFMTLGLVGLLINPVILLVTVHVAQGYGSGLAYIDGIGSAIMASIVIAIMNAVLGPMFGTKKESNKK